MGEIHNLRCCKCGYGIEAWLGIGMLYHPDYIFYGSDPSLVELVDNKDISNQALSLLNSGIKPNDSHRHKLYACPNDFYLFSKFYFKIDDFEPKYPCPYCKSVLKQVIFTKGTRGTTRLKFEDNDEIWHCPKCKSELLEEMAFGNWD